MVHEVVRGEAELQLLAFVHLEVLEDRKIAGPVPWSEEFRQYGWPVLALHRGSSEAAPVQELVRPQVLPRIAGQDWHQRYLVGPVDGLGRNMEPARQITGYPGDVEVPRPSVGVGRHVDPALHRGDTRNLPAVDDLSQRLAVGVVHGDVKIALLAHPAYLQSIVVG